MESVKPSAKTRLAGYLDQRQSATVTEADWREIRERFSDVSAGYLRRLLRDSGRELAPLVEGVRQDNLDELERTLAALEAEHAAAGEREDRSRQAEIRRLVIEAKDHARWAARRANSYEKRSLKREMSEWMLVWLEDPAAFPVWARLRRKAIEADRGTGSLQGTDEPSDNND